MPYCKIETNAVLGESELTNAMEALSAEMAACLGKPEAYVMTRIASSTQMSFAGTTEPCAYCHLISLGLSDEAIPALSTSLTDLIAKTFSLPSNRIYIRFESPQRDHFAHNGVTFG